MLNVFPSNIDVVVGDVDDEMLQVPQVTETQKKKNKSQNTCIFTRSTLKILWEQKKRKLDRLTKQKNLTQFSLLILKHLAHHFAKLLKKHTKLTKSQHV